MENKQPTEAQIKEFWEWCGLGCVHDWQRDNYTPAWGHDCTKCGKQFRSSQWSRTNPPVIGELSDYPPIDLNNLFKYAVPKLEIPNYRLEHINFYPNWNEIDNYLCDLTFSQREPDNYSPYSCEVRTSQGGTPALALFWAIWEVIHGN
jgi:hypothetical protein